LHRISSSAFSRSSRATSAASVVAAVFASRASRSRSAASSVFSRSRDSRTTACVSMDGRGRGGEPQTGFCRRAGLAGSGGSGVRAAAASVSLGLFGGVGAARLAA
jgi:hypothetical protein